MNGGKKLLDRVTVTLKNCQDGSLMPVYVDVFDHGLAEKWLTALNQLLRDGYHLEKNYCFLGFADSKRDANLLCELINRSIHKINVADLGYHIDDHFSLYNTLTITPQRGPAPDLVQEKFNRLHHYFEDLQGVSGRLSEFYHKADAATRWHIRQLNLLCHEFESWALSYRKKIKAPEWQRPSQLMCWLNAPRFSLEATDLQYFGIDTLMRPTGGVFVGVNKAVGKHHWEVFNDEGKDSRIDELTTSTLRTQTEASGDFDIEWAKNTAGFDFMIQQINDFRRWLIHNGFDPEDPELTIGHPQVAQVDLEASFGTLDHIHIWMKLNKYLDVWQIETSDQKAQYHYHWADPDYADQQIQILERTMR